MLTAWRSITLLGGATAALLAVTIAPSATADTTNLINSSLLSLRKQFSTSSRPSSWDGNIPCFENNMGICEVQTFYGDADHGSNLRLAGEETSLPVVSSVDGRTRFLPIPNSSTGMAYTTEPPYGVNLHFWYNITSRLEKKDTPGGPRYFIISPPQARLQDQTGNQLAADTSSMNFSANGEWMVVSVPNVAIVRVNLNTFDVIPFAAGFNYTIGIDPGIKTSISNDGRYAIVASQNFGRTELYDLSTCNETPHTVVGPVQCQGRSLQNYLQAQIPGYSFADHFGFLGNDALSFYAKSTEEMNTRYILTDEPGFINYQDLIALGDSYISGEGAYEYLAGTDTDSSQCHVSRLSYPLMAGRDLGFNSYHSATCSGATTKDIIDSTKGYIGQVKPYDTREDLGKLNQIPVILSQFQQGYIYQNNFVEQYQPKIVILSIGGNDIGFSNRLKSCLMPDTCYESYEDRLQFVKEVNGKFDTLVNTYKKIKNAGPPDMRIYVVGYPQLSKPDGDCGLNVRMNREELEFAELAVNYIDAIIHLAADKAGVFYVDTEGAFSGHRLCEAGGESAAMNGVTAGDDFPDQLGGPIGRESYHPNAFGHQLLENTVLRLTNNLTAPMPSPNASTKPPDTLGLPILTATVLNTEVRNTQFTDSLSPDVVFKNQPFTMSLDGTSYGLSPNSTIEGAIWSSPTALGSFTSDQFGNLSATVNIPASIDPGFHTIHLLANNLNGTKLDFFKNIYVAETPEDFDGDGITDNGNICFQASGIDKDSDGLDDACDGDILAQTIPSTTNATVVALGAGPATINFAQRVTIGAKPFVKQKAENHVLATSTAKPDPNAETEPTNTPLPRYGLIFLSAISGIALSLSKKYS